MDAAADGDDTRDAVGSSDDEAPAEDVGCVADAAVDDEADADCAADVDGLVVLETLGAAV